MRNHPSLVRIGASSIFIITLLLAGWDDRTIGSTGINRAQAQTGTAIGDSVWIDADQDGRFDDEESGYAGMEVILWVDEDGDNKNEYKWGRTTTNENGNYSFDDLDANFNYQVQFVIATGMNIAFTTQQAISNTARDSDADPLSGRTAHFTVQAGEYLYTIDAGVISLSTPTPTITPSLTPSPTVEPSATPSPTITNTPPPDATPTATYTQTPPPTATPTQTATASPSLTPSIPPTPSITPTPSNTPFPSPTPLAGDLYYVSKFGTNGDGLSWESAWNELDQIDWSVIQPGATIIIDGGLFSLTYETPLTVEASGEPTNPIKLTLSLERGRNGQAEFFGGRSALLPECGHQEVDFDDPTHNFGIYIDNQSHIVIEGTRFSGIHVHGFGMNGVYLGRNSSHVTLRNLEVSNNGEVKWDEVEAGGYYSDEPGIRLGGTDHLLERMLIHDNGQDAIQASWDDNTNKNFTLRQSWLYNGRPHSTARGSFNWCSHTDGIHFFEENALRNILIEESIVGPGFTNNLMFGELTTYVQNVTIRDVLLIKPDENGLNTKINPNARNILLERVTLDCGPTRFNCLRLFGDGHIVRDTIIVGGDVEISNPLVDDSGNCHFEVTGERLGAELDPLFESNRPADLFSLDDYQVNEPACVGSGLTSTAQLLALADPKFGVPVNNIDKGLLIFVPFAGR